jgi:3-hydroxyisobutyrate dehydrogenase-like beta-hydroxyacid dehydrogenase
MDNHTRLGWIGVGNMGSRMATRLIQAGYTVTVCGSGHRDLSDFARRTKARLAQNPREVAERAEILFSSIPDGETLLQIVSGETGICRTDFQGKILVDMSTVDPDTSAEANRRIEAAGGHFLRAPVTGSTHFAQTGTLGIMASGEREIYERCLPLLQCLGNRQTYLGTGEEARVIKIVINMLLGNILQAYAESLVLGEKLGLNWSTMIDLLADSAAAAPLICYKASTVKQRDFTPTSTGYNMHKDLKMATHLAQQVNANLPLTTATQQMFNSLVSRGLSDKDSSAIILVNEASCGIDARDGGEEKRI